MASLILTTIFAARDDNNNNNNNNQLYANCTTPGPLCPIDSSYYYYRVSLGANVAFLTLFSLSFLGFVATYAITRRATAFTVAMVVGVTLEIIGYIGRILSYQNQWEQNGFLMQIVCLTIAPAFLAAGIYLCLRRIVYAFGPANSRIKPETYTRFFIPCDVVSLLLQAAGGGTASAETHSNESADTGDNIMIAGLAFQVLTLAIFILLCADFAYNTIHRQRKLGSAAAFDQDPVFVALRGKWQFKGFLVTLALATICIFWRSVYRVAELSEGWTGHLIRQQNLFIGFEGVMVIVACFALNLFHPALTFKEGMTGAGGVGSGRRARKQQKLQQHGAADAQVEKADGFVSASGSASASDVDARTAP